MLVGLLASIRLQELVAIENAGMSAYLVQKVSSFLHRYRHGDRCEIDPTRRHFCGNLEGQIASQNIACCAIKQSIALVGKDDRISNNVG